MTEKAGAILKANRKKAGLSLERLAELAGCSFGKISKLESGTQKITTEWATRLAPHVGLRPYDLLPDFIEEEMKVDLRARGLTAESFEKLETFYNFLLHEDRKSKK